MKNTRRKFIKQTSAAVAASTLTGALHGLTLHTQASDSSASTIKVGYAAITWGDRLADAFADISSLGYRGIQLRANAVDLHPDPLLLKQSLSTYHLKFTALSSGDLTLDPAKQAANLALHKSHATYLKQGGGQYLQILGTFRSSGVYTDEEYRRTARMLNEVGRYAVDQGVQIGFHNHMGSIAQTPAQLARILDATNPNYVRLLLDVAHYQQGGGNPVEAIRRYADRILYVHFKDVRPAGNAAGYEFVELGQGTVDLRAVVEALRRIRFSGWAIVELDQVPSKANRTPKECAAISKRYLEDELKIKV